MAALTSSTSLLVPAALSNRSAVAAPQNASLAKKTVSNGSRVSCMKVWNPINNPRFETLSYLPAMTDDIIAKQVSYMIKNGWVPCLEFDASGVVYRENNSGPGYYDGRYWTMWKLPLFGCTDPNQVLRELNECKNAYPQCFIRVLGFDNINQVQCTSFIAYKP